MNTLFSKTATITGGDIRVFLLFKGGGGGQMNMRPLGLSDKGIPRNSPPVATIYFHPILMLSSIYSSITFQYLYNHTHIDRLFLAYAVPRKNGALRRWSSLARLCGV